MKTIFKEGMEVYDQVNFPDKEGVVIKIDNFPCPVIVEFDKEKYSYRLDGSFQFGAKPTLSTKPYEVEFKGFEQKSPTPNYEKALEWLEKNSKDRVIYADEAYINEEYERAFEALKKLTILRDYYNDGWQPDWNTSGFKQCIELEGKVVCGRDHAYSSRVLTFKSGEIRDKFLEEQRELLEIAKPLL